jgi:hypothetical protein
MHHPHSPPAKPKFIQTPPELQTTKERILSLATKLQINQNRAGRRKLERLARSGNPEAEELVGLLGMSVPRPPRRLRVKRTRHIAKPAFTFDESVKKASLKARSLKDLFLRVPLFGMLFVLSGCAYLQPAANAVHAACTLDLIDSPVVQSAAERRELPIEVFADLVCANAEVIAAYRKAPRQRTLRDVAAIRKATELGLLE